MSCAICLEPFQNPQILNCGHSYCLTCVQTLQEYSRNNSTCPECRQRIVSYTPNYSLNNINNDEISSQMNIKEKTKFIIYDNSNSMRMNDGNIIIKRNDVIESIGGYYRYEEGKQCVEFIIEECMKRKEEIAIYLMNKLSNDEKYIEDIDYIIINSENYNNKREILNNLLSNDSIYGMTPLTEITKKIKNEIYKKERNHKDRVYTIIYITDGEPNSNRANEKNTFKQELRSLITNIPCELIFNIISDDEAVVNYYNNLDVELNKTALKRAMELSEKRGLK